MFDSIISYVSAVASPSMMAASASYCMVNGKEVDCAGFGGPILALLGGFWMFALAFCVLMIVSNWKIYTKAGKPGWTSIIPIYNMVVLLEIVGKPTWWVILMFVPVVNIIVSIIVIHRLSRSFGKDIVFTIGLLLLSIVFYPILAFGNAQYSPIVDNPTVPPSPNPNPPPSTPIVPPTTTV